jgi:hypothetical protein
MWVTIAHSVLRRNLRAIKNLLSVPFNTTSKGRKPLPLVSAINNRGHLLKKEQQLSPWNIPLVLKHGSAKRCWFYFF